MRAVAAIVSLWLIGCSGRSCSNEGAARGMADASPVVVASNAIATPSDASDLVSHASAQWDAGPQVLPSGSIDAAALRAARHDRLRTASKVTIVRGASARELGERICRAVVPIRPPDTPVLLKPNIGGFDWFKDPTTSGGDDGVKGRITDPEFVRGVIACLKARGHTKITVAEGWGATHKEWLRLVSVSGYASMTAEEKVPLVAMDDDGVFDVEGDAPGKPLGLSGMEATHVPTLLVPKILAEHLQHGMFISLPKVKAHRFGVVSLSVKGMQGTVMLSDATPAFRQKWRMHRELNPWLDARKKDPSLDDRAGYVAALEAFSERMADVLEVEAPDVVLADGAPAMGGDGFQKLVPSAEMVAIGGTNPVLVDRVGAQFLGLWNVPALARELGGHASSPLIEVAAKRFGLDLAALPEVEGDGKALLDVPRPVHFVAMAPFAIHGDGAASSPRDASALDGAPNAASDLGLKEVHAVRGEPAIDGDARDPIWTSAPEIAWDTDYAGRPTGTRTRARFAWSNRALFALFSLEGTGLHTDASRPIDVERARLYEEDCVELFVNPAPATPKHYYEIELGPFGHFFDIEVDRSAAARENVAWSAHLKVATKRDVAARTATIEASIGADEIVTALTPSARLRLGLFRMEGTGKRLYLAWSPPRTEKPNFHVPDAFGTIVLDP